MIQEWPVANVILKHRIRKDLGDIASLADSIKQVGLLHPILIMRDGTLIVGERRLRAAQMLEHATILARVIGTDQPAACELHENSARKNFTPEESVEASEAAWEEAQRKAEERKAEGQQAGGEAFRQRGLPKNFRQASPEIAAPAKNPPRVPSTDTRDRIAPIVGTSGRTLEKARQVVQASRQDPERFRPLVDQMNKTGKVDAAYKQVREEQRKDEIRQAVATKNEQPTQSLFAPAGDHVIHTGDALDVMARLDSGSVDLIFTDPPYNISGYGGATKVGGDYTTMAAGEWDDQDPDEFLRWIERVLREFHRLLADHGAFYLFLDRCLISHVWDMAKRVGFTPKCVIYWRKTNPPVNPRRNFDSAVETFIWAVKGPEYLFNRPTTGALHNLWEGPLVSGMTRQKWPHPTAKPVGLIERYLPISSLPGQLVLDPFGGSGSTLEAAVRLGRRCIAIDKSEDYTAMMAARLAATMADLHAGVTL